MQMPPQGLPATALAIAFSVLLVSCAREPGMGDDELARVGEATITVQEFEAAMRRRGGGGGGAY